MVLLASPHHPETAESHGPFCVLPEHVHLPASVSFVHVASVVQAEAAVMADVKYAIPWAAQRAQG